MKFVEMDCSTLHLNWEDPPTYHSLMQVPTNQEMIREHFKHRIPLPLPIPLIVFIRNYKSSSRGYHPFFT